MTDTNDGATGTQADPGTQPPAGNAEAQAAAATGEQTAPETISLDEAKKLRSEANSLRRRLKELEDADKARKDAELSETERQAAKLKASEERETALIARVRQLATVGAAARLGFADPEDAVRFIDFSGLDTEADGTPKGVETVLQELAKAKPYLLATQRPNPGSFDTGKGAPSATPRTFTRAQLRDPAYYAQHEAEILLAMREGRITG